MSKRFTKFLNRFMSDESGQGITEYGAILAFVALLVGIAFSFKGALQTAISGAFSSIVTQLNQISGG